MTYAEKLKDPRWQKLRLNVMSRDCWMCCDCRSKEKQLTVHHTHYEKGNPWDTSPDFLITLCWDCHQAREATEGRIKRAIGALLALYNQWEEDGDPTWLGELASDLEAQVLSVRDSDGVVEDIRITDANEIEYVSDIRWYQYACENPKSRSMYVAVTGFNPWRRAKEGKR